MHIVCSMMSTNGYIAVIEYYNPTPVEVEYRGHHSVLFQRDFASELMDRYPDVYNRAGDPTCTEKQPPAGGQPH